ncbi:hypothetical protein JCM33374_g5614 [Metschnikowia sp. JCM 33374]|nr:hypothetical protein JCM33374_g5614 [Metschnikowia sp. JCM 33374]
MDELIVEARKGTVTPLIEFLMAYEHPEDYIWFMVSYVFSKFLLNPKDVRFFEEEQGKLRTSSTQSLIRRVNRLVTNLKAEGILKVEDTESSLIAQVPTPKLNTPGPKDSEEDDEVSPQPGTKRHKFTRAEKHEYWKSMETKRKSEASKNASNGNSNHD